eukprot:TRINITY_DN1749_c0_g1_i1.p1 TRINITY_DN1749_c0_g1~~TRINITY_DN1749_c0_g1_i1.p1  ORF type:complete len:195 (+),score=2.43 TRINITY_DN1749_c0_g1_i1:34-585(+)
MKVYGEDKIRLHPRAGKLGLGSAYKHGLTFTTGNFVVILDADMSHHPKFITKMIELQKASDLDIVTGSRYIPGGGVHGWDLVRKLTSRGANYVAQTFLNPGVTDLTGSFRLYKKSVLTSLIPSIKADGYVFQVETIVRAKAKGFKVGEVPITFVDRQFGKSKMGIKEVVAYLGIVFSLWFELD